MQDAIQRIHQEFNEKRYNRKHIDLKIREELLANEEVQSKIQQGVQLVRDLINGSYYASKMARLAQLKDMDLEQLVIDVFVGVAYFQKEELFTSVTAQMAGRLQFSEKIEAIKTMAEIMAVLCQTDAFDIWKASKGASLVVISRLPLSDVLLDFIVNSEYLPPMVCEPMPLVSNRTSGYLTHNDSLILGKGNHHDGDICLDVLNTLNQQAYSLDLEYLCKVEEQPTFALDTPEKVTQWAEFKRQSYRFYDLMQSQGNRFHFLWKVDKRGRTYSSGYHLNPQGTSFKKAMLNLAKEELVTGVPS